MNKYPLLPLSSAFPVVAIVGAMLYAGICLSAAQSDPTKGSHKVLMAASTHATELTAKPIRVELSITKNKDKNADLGSRLGSLPASQHIYLVLKGLHATSQPGTLFHIYLDLAEGVTPNPEDIRHLGSINFYNAIPVQDAPKNKAPLVVSLDITDAIRTLQSKRSLGHAGTITIAPTRPPEAGAKPVIDHIEIIAR